MYMFFTQLGNNLNVCEVGEPTRETKSNSVRINSQLFAMN